MVKQYIAVCTVRMFIEPSAKRYTGQTTSRCAAAKHHRALTGRYEPGSAWFWLEDRGLRDLVTGSLGQVSEGDPPAGFVPLQPLRYLTKADPPELQSDLVTEAHPLTPQ